MARNLRDHLEALMHAFDEAWASIAPTRDLSSVRPRKVGMDDLAALTAAALASFRKRQPAVHLGARNRRVGAGLIQPLFLRAIIAVTMIGRVREDITGSMLTKSKGAGEVMNQLAENDVCGIVVRDKYEREQWRVYISPRPIDGSQVLKPLRGIGISGCAEEWSQKARVRSGARGEGSEEVRAGAVCTTRGISVHAMKAILAQPSRWNI